MSARRWLTLSCLGAALTGPVQASAQTMAAPAQAPRSVSTPRHAADRGRVETLDQRISTLHAALKITTDEEADWSKVADVMRRNDRDMQKLVADHQAEGPQELSAVDDLKTYEKLTQAHVDGLKDLLVSFEALYAAMPADQKTLADHVFAKYVRSRVPAHHAMAQS
jgi:hypothetical protein